MKQLKQLGRTKSPCFECQDRQSGCHANCERYSEFQRLHQKEVDIIRENKRKHYQTFWSFEHRKQAAEQTVPVWKQRKR